jgi:hypothetical protein
MSNTIDLTPINDAIDRAVKTIATLERLHHADRIAYREDEATKLIGCKPKTLRDLRLAGEIRARKVGKSWFYTRDTLTEFLSA